MKTHIALFRGINVGGRNTLPMNALVALLEGCDLQNAKTYIQSGNAVFRSKEKNTSALSKRIRAAINQSFGFEPQVFLLDVDALEKTIASNPFLEAESAPNTLHVNFLAAAPKNPNLKAMEDIKSDRERFILTGSVFYLHAPDGIGRSKLAANLEKLLGVAATGRNWRTVCKIAAMAKECN